MQPQFKCLWQRFQLLLIVCREGPLQHLCTKLLQGLAECHGMASGLLHHSESILFNQTSAAPHGMVYALMGEFSSHKTHLSTFLAIAKPIFLTRLILLTTQVCLALHQHPAYTAYVLLTCVRLLI